MAMSVLRAAGASVIPCAQTNHDDLSPRFKFSGERVLSDAASTSMGVTVHENDGIQQSLILDRLKRVTSTQKKRRILRSTAQEGEAGASRPIQLNDATKKDSFITILDSDEGSGAVAQLATNGNSTVQSPLNSNLPSSGLPVRRNLAQWANQMSVFSGDTTINSQGTSQQVGDNQVSAAVAAGLMNKIQIDISNEKQFSATQAQSDLKKLFQVNKQNTFPIDRKNPPPPRRSVGVAIGPGAEVSPTNSSKRNKLENLSFASLKIPAEPRTLEQAVVQDVLNINESKELVQKVQLEHLT